jgi:prepilin-type processing-associated H-X9-DG protein
MTDEHCTQDHANSLPARHTFMSCGGCFWTAAGVFVVLAAIALLTPMTRPNRWVVQRVVCCNNLRAIGLAMFNYEAKYHRFPPAYTVDKQGRRMHSWRVLLLEFLDPALYAQYDFSRPWDSPANLAIAAKMKEDGPYRCPSEDIKDPSWTSYVMLVGPTAFSNGPTGRKLEQITDGLSNTVAVVEMSPSGILWTAPYDLNVAEMSFKINDPDHACPRSCHSGGMNMLICDGSVSFFIASLPNAEKCLKAMSTINGGEDMSKFPQ